MSHRGADYAVCHRGAAIGGHRGAIWQWLQGPVYAVSHRGAAIGGHRGALWSVAVAALIYAVAQGVLPRTRMTGSLLGGGLRHYSLYVHAVSGHVGCKAILAHIRFENIVAGPVLSFSSCCQVAGHLCVFGSWPFWFWVRDCILGSPRGASLFLVVSAALGRLARGFFLQRWRPLRR